MRIYIELPVPRSGTPASQFDRGGTARDLLPPGVLLQDMPTLLGLLMSSNHVVQSKDDEQHRRSVIVLKQS